MELISQLMYFNADFLKDFFPESAITKYFKHEQWDKKTLLPLLLKKYFSFCFIGLLTFYFCTPDLSSNPLGKKLRERATQKQVVQCEVITV